MDREILIKISPNGDVFFITNGDHPLLEGGLDGTPTLMRASNVIRDNTDGLWYVHMNDPEDPTNKDKVTKFPMGHARRRDAITAEVDYLMKMMEEQPGYYDKMFDRPDAEMAQSG